MAHNLQRTNLAANTEADAVCALLNNGYIRIYDGTQPATGDTAITSQVLLAELTFASTAFGTASGGIAVANSIGPDVSANASGTATWARLFKSDGTTSVMDCSVGTSGADINLTTVTIVLGAAVSITAMTYTARKVPC